MLKITAFVFTCLCIATVYPTSVLGSTTYADFKDGLALVQNEYGCVFVDKAGQTRITFEKSEPGYGFSEGLAVVTKDNKYGYLDKKGNVTINFQWDLACNFSDGLAYVEKSNQRGFINKSGKMVVVLEKSYYSGDFSNGLACVRNNGKYGFIDKQGNVAIPFNMDYAMRFSEGLAFARMNNTRGFINTSGKMVISLEKSQYSGNFSDGLACVYKDGSYGYLDKSGNIVIPFQWSMAKDFSDGFAYVEKGSKKGFIDKSGKMLITLEKSNYFGNFSEGLAAITVDNKIGYMNKTGDVVIHHQYQIMQPWEKVFKARYNSINVDLINAYNHSDIVKCNGYLCDIDQDGLPELMVDYNVKYTDGFSSKIYKYINGEAIYIGGSSVASPSYHKPSLKTPQMLEGIKKGKLNKPKGGNFKKNEFTVKLL